MVELVVVKEREQKVFLCFLWVAEISSSAVYEAQKWPFIKTEIIKAADTACAKSAERKKIPKSLPKCWCSRKLNTCCFV